MPPSICGKLNDEVGGYDYAGTSRDYEGQEVDQHLLLVSISSLYDVSLFGRGQ